MCRQAAEEAARIAEDQEAARKAEEEAIAKLSTDQETAEVALNEEDASKYENTELDCFELLCAYFTFIYFPFHISIIHNSHVEADEVDG